MTLFVSCSRSHRSNFNLSSASNKAAMLQLIQYTKSFSKSTENSPLEPNDAHSAPSLRPSNSCMKLVIFPTRPSAITSLVFLLKNVKHCPGSVGVQLPNHFLTSDRKTSFLLLSGLFLIHDSSTGAQSNSVSLTYMIPARETVAGEAFTNVSTSNMILTLSVIGMRSPFAKVKILLSSRTVFRSSIQIASTGPSAIIHVLYALFRLLYLAHSAANTPVVHSPLSGSVSPYISCARIAFGLKRTSL
mmetsp:Transcript_27606/g.40737  ORF Transcript_27606/g.40737 Transcript_27606/m.40737 type:complete len:245 (-) Transcript_27606:3092-3826(-)